MTAGTNAPPPSSPDRPSPSRLACRFVAAVVILALLTALGSGIELRSVIGADGGGFGEEDDDQGGEGTDTSTSIAGSAGARGGTKSFVWADDPGDSSHWVESRDPTNRGERDIRISFRLHDPGEVGRPRKFLSVSGYRCFGTSPLPKSLQSRGIMDFTVTISTDLNVLFVGDSIAQQFAQGHYSSVLPDEDIGSHVIVRAFINGQDPRLSGLHVCSSIVAPGRGGGAAAYWRILELMSNKTEERTYVNCKKETTWMAREGEKLTNHHYLYPAFNISKKNEIAEVLTNKNNGATTWMRSRIEINQTAVHREEYHQVGEFDVCVLRPPNGWMKLEDITRERIEEEIRLCGQVVGARTAIVTTVPHNNNVITPQDWERIIEINDFIRDIARSWDHLSSGRGGVKWVLVQEFGDFTNQLLWHNAKASPYDSVVIVTRNLFFLILSFSIVLDGVAHWLQHDDT